ncbi:MAG: hypothetical protein ACI9FN_002825 [Saprospiraceae bacterium]|jgi:uncharacterized protein (DUF885 family)
MKYSILYVFLAFSALSSCTNQGGTPDNSSQYPIQELFADYYEGRLKLYPLEATSSGDNRFNDLLPNVLSDEFQNKEKEFYAKFKSALGEYEYNTLSENDKTSYDILLWECDIAIDGFQFHADLMPIDQMWTPQLTIGQLASGSSAQPFETIEDYNNWIQRVDRYLEWMTSAESNIRKGIEEGFVLPKPLIEKVIPQLEALDHGPVEQHLFYGPINNIPASFSGEDKDRIRKEYSAMVKDKVIPAYKRIAAFFKEEYLPNGRNSSGISVLSDGAAYYDHLIKKFTTTTMSADEVHKIGLSEVSRLRTEMEKVMKQVEYKGDLDSFFGHVRDLKQLKPFDTAEEVIENFNQIHETMKPHLSALFDLTPKSPFEVRRTEAFREASASAEYNPGSIDGTRPGIFYVPIPDIKNYNVVSDEDLFLHEAIPGHHYQISLQQENDLLPDFRKTLWYSAYGEGWALYSESLGSELGLYTDPYQYFGMLSAEMHRAIRLVVDTGLHAKGWTREEAIQYSLENEAESEAGIISEIERYMAMPGQALSYKIGQLKIIELRKKAEAKMGDRFDIKKFHNKVLESGCLPLKILEDKLNTWMS